MAEKKGKKIRIKSIKTDGGTQSRAEIDEATIKEYANAMHAGDKFPPIAVFFDGDVYWMADGFHRLEAVKKLKHRGIIADVRQGGRRDAILYSVGANAAHGLRRTIADKRQAVECLLNDPEWAEKSNMWIAEKCSVSSPFVSKVKSESDSKRLESTLRKDGESDSKRLESTLRKGRDGRTINTANIGRRAPEPESDETEDMFGDEEPEEEEEESDEEEADEPEEEEEAHDPMIPHRKAAHRPKVDLDDSEKLKSAKRSYTKLAKRDRSVFRRWVNENR